MAVFSQTFLPLINFGDRLFQSRLFKDLKTVPRPIEANEIFLLAVIGLGSGHSPQVLRMEIQGVGDESPGAEQIFLNTLREQGQRFRSTKSGSDFERQVKDEVDVRGS